MVNEKYDDKKILKDIFLGSLELADPAKKLEKMKFDSPLGRLFFVAVGKGAGRLAKAFYKTYAGKADGIVVDNELQMLHGLADYLSLPKAYANGIFVEEGIECK